MSGEALAQFTADIEAFKTDDSGSAYRLAMTFAEIFPLDALVSLVSAGLLRESGFLARRRAQACHRRRLRQDIATPRFDATASENRLGCTIGGCEDRPTGVDWSANGLHFGADVTKRASVWPNGLM